MNHARPLAAVAFAIAAGLSLWVAGCAHVKPRPASEPLDTGGPLVPEQAAYDVRHSALDLRILPGRKSIQGTATIEIKTLQATSWLVLDLDTPLHVGSVHQWPAGQGSSRRALHFQRRGSRLWIHLGREEPSGSSLVLEIDYKGRPREAGNPPWDGGFTWAKTKDGLPWIATSVQTEGADLWFPCKDHPSDKPESFTLRVTVPKPLVVAANGRLVEVLEHDDGTWTYHWHTSVPISSYNVALNIAPYRTLEEDYQSVTGESIPVTYWVLPENFEKAKGLFPEFLEHLAFYERLLGPYPFRAEKYGVAETPHLGMEHQTIIAYGNAYKGGPHGYDWLHHHELGHEWWGNLVTAEDWRHFWIHEGFCTYMQALYAEEREGPMAYHHAMYTSRKRVASTHPLVPDKPAGMRSMDETLGKDVYFKGAWVLHTLRYLIGDEAFFRCLRRMAYPTAEWESRRDGSACRFVSSEEFVATVHRITGRSYDWFFNLYLYQGGLPKLVSNIQGDRLILEWITPRDLPFPMPVEVRVGETIQRIEMPEGKASLDAGRFGQGLIDPNLWILKEHRLISASKVKAER